MKLLFDFFPILLFFIAFKLSGIYVATATAIAASMGQVTWSWLRHRRVEKMHLVTFGVIVVFGGATLLLRDEMFIKWKPTVASWLIGAVFIASQFLARKPLLQSIMETALPRDVSFPDWIWPRLNLYWGLFSVALGFANLYVVYNFDTETWVNFKVFGVLGLNALFAIALMFYVSRYAKVETQGDTEKEP